jgi:transposase
MEPKYLDLGQRAELRKTIAIMLCTNPGISSKQIVQRLMEQGYNRRTIYRNIKRIKEDQIMQELPRSGRSKSIPSSIRRKIVRASKNRIGASLRKMGKRYGVHHNSIRNILKESGYAYHKRQTKPKYTQKQLEIIPKRALALYRYFLWPKTECIMDDEKYFTLSKNSLSQNSGYWAKNKSLVSPEIKYKMKSKFEPKVLVWVAISSRGLSGSYIQTSRSVSISQLTYLENCLKPNLLDFITRNHADVETIFWPDLASSHYSKTVTDWLKLNCIKFVPKSANPPNCPQVRPIETFWALLEQMVYSNGWQAKNVQDLSTRIKRCIKNFDKNLCASLMKGLRSKVRILAREGPFSSKFD